MERTLSLVVFVVIFLSCFTSNALAVDGWASWNGGTTGGGSLTPIDVSTAADFKTNVESDSPCVVRVVGTIDLGGGVNIKSNKTIMGLDTSSTIIGRLGFTNGSSNIIIQGLNITNPSYAEKDGISVKNTITNLFITKCNVYDCGDGCIDITNASDFITVSWCKFYYSNPAPVEGHRYVNLFSASDTATGDRGKLRITFHHNWWADRCDQRMPRGRFGKVHVYNNYYSCTGNLYCIGVGLESQLRVENNYFDNVNNAWYNPATTPGIIGWNTGNVFVNTAIPTWAPNNYATIFEPNYTYTLDAGADVKSLVMACAGNVVCGGSPPGQASGPVPSTGATDVSITQDISWTAGSGATSRDVYFGTVNPPVTKVIADGTVLTYDTGTMASITTYYWRVDEKNTDGTTTGTVWSFTTQDTNAPLPNPMEWAVEPNAISSSAITMTAHTATDISGVEYYFANTTDPNHDSNWVSSYVWTDTGLVNNTVYTYQVKARDMSINHNETGWSNMASATTWIYDCTSQITSDLDDDCEVDFFDYALLADVWTGNLLDIAQFATDWLTCNRDPASECWQ